MQARQADLTTAAELPCTLVPYVPPEVFIMDLGRDFFLVTPEERELIDKNITATPDRRVTKEMCRHFWPNPRYSILVHHGQKYILYKGRKQHRQAGIGSTAVVKHLQHLQTGDWYVVKIISRIHQDTNGEDRNNDPPAIHDLIVKEHACLKDLDLAIGLYGRRESKSKGDQAYLVMQSAKGADLYDFLENENMRSKIHPLHMLEILLSMAYALKNLHEKFYVHRDFKVENFRYKYSDNLATLVDYNTALKFSSANPVVCFDVVSGSPKTVAPESFDYSCTAAADVYALGVEIGFQFNLVFWDGRLCRELYNKKAALLHGSQIIDDENILSQLYELCQKILNSDAQMRPSLTEVISELEKIQRSKIDKPVIVGFIDLDLFVKKSIDERKMLIDDLLPRCHEIVLIAEKELSVSPGLVGLMQKIENRGVRVYNRVYHTHETEKILAELMRRSPNITRVLISKLAVVAPKSSENQLPENASVATSKATLFPIQVQVPEVRPSRSLHGASKCSIV